MQSVHNISIERAWLHLHLEFGDSAVIAFKKAKEDGIYLFHILEHACLYSTLLLLSFYKLIYINLSSQLCQWLWPKLLRKLAKEFMES